MDDPIQGVGDGSTFKPSSAAAATAAVDGAGNGVPDRATQGFKNSRRAFLQSHPGNRVHNGYRIHYKQWYRREERAHMRDIHGRHYFKFNKNSHSLKAKPIPSSEAPDGKKIAQQIAFLESACMLSEDATSAQSQLRERKIQRAARDATAADSNSAEETTAKSSVVRDTTGQDVPTDNTTVSAHHISSSMPVTQPRVSKGLLSVCGTIEGQVVRCLLDTACQSQLCSSSFADRFLSGSQLEHSWYIKSHGEVSENTVSEFASAQLDLGGFVEQVEFFITDLDGYDVVLGLPWFEDHNPLIDFKNRILRFAHPTNSNGIGDEEVINLRCELHTRGNGFKHRETATSPMILSMMASMRSSAMADDDDDDDDFLPEREPRHSSRRASTRRQVVSDSDDDSNENLAAEPESGGKKRKGKAKAPVPAKRRATGRREAIGGDVSHPPAAQPFIAKPSFDVDTLLDRQGVDIEAANQSFKDLVNAIKHNGLREKSMPDDTERYTPGFNQAVRVLELGLYDPATRLFQLVIDEVAKVDHVQPDRSTTKRWRLIARNITDPSAEDVELYMLPAVWLDRARCTNCSSLSRGGCPKGQNREDPCERCVQRGVGAECAADNLFRMSTRFAVMTEDVCDDRDLVIALGKIAVDLMNRVNFENLNLPAWKFRAFHDKMLLAVCPEQRFIETVSLVEWKDQHCNSFNLASLPKLAQLSHKGWLGDPWSKAWYGAPLQIVKRGGTIVSFEYPAVYVAEDTGDPGWLHHEDASLAVPMKFLDFTAAEAIVPVSAEYHIFGQPGEYSLDRKTAKKASTDDGNDGENARRSTLAVEVTRTSAYELTGMIGNSRQLKEIHEDLKGRYTVKKHFVNSGPYKNSPLLLVQSATGDPGWDIVFPEAIWKDLEATDGSNVRDILARKFYVRSTDQVCLAWIYQQALDALARGDGLIQILLQAYIAVYKLNKGMTSRTTILENYCSCQDSVAARSTEHVCTKCRAIRVCANMLREESPDGTLVKCSGCANREFEVPHIDLRLFVSRVKACTKFIYNNELLHHRPKWTKLDMIKAALKHACKDPHVYLCGYTNKETSLKNAVWATREDHWCCPNHPDTLSFERPHLRIVGSDNQIALHEPDTNFAVIKYALNIVKGGDPPCMLPILKRAMQLKMKTMDRTPQRGYDDDVDLDWRIVHRAIHNYHVINAQSPTADSRRLLVDHDINKIRACTAMEKTGVFDERPLVGEHRILQLPQSGLHKDFKYQDQYWIWEDIVERVEEMEIDTRPDGFNPHRLLVPRLGLNQLPWLWQEDYCNSNSDYTDEFIFRVFSRRLAMMDYQCDRKNKTVESPQTLFLEAVAQWLQTGGKCHVFGWIMSPFSNDPAKFSFGRAIIQYRSEEMGGNRRIPPGAPMQTGCESLAPRSMMTDYNISRRTVVIESWKANRLRFRYPNTEDLTSILVRIVLELQDSCKWYDGLCDDLDDYPQIPLPTMTPTKTYRNAYLSALREFATSTGQPPERVEAEVDEAGEIIDDEELFYTELLEEQDETEQVSLLRKNQYQFLHSAAIALGCVSRADIKQSLEELYRLLDNDSGEAGDRSDALIAKLNHSLEQISDEQSDNEPHATESSGGHEMVTVPDQDAIPAGISDDPSDEDESNKTLKQRYQEAYQAAKWLKMSNHKDIKPLLAELSQLVDSGSSEDARQFDILLARFRKALQQIEAGSAGVEPIKETAEPGMTRVQFFKKQLATLKTANALPANIVGMLEKINSMVDEPFQLREATGFLVDLMEQGEEVSLVVDFRPKV